jgi:hypothetical protein
MPPGLAPLILSIEDRLPLFTRRKYRKSLNLMELTPVQRVPWEMGESGNVVVLVPKFQNPLMVRWVVPRMKFPDIRVKLDTLGSFVWKMCDGSTTVAEMSNKLTAEFGDTATSAQERIRKFLLMLEKSDLVNLYDSATSAQQ